MTQNTLETLTKNRIKTTPFMISLAIIFILTGAYFTMTAQTHNTSIPTQENNTTMQTTPSGLQYVDTKVGDGPSPKPGQRVTVHYHGTLQDGTVFDSSKNRNQPFTFTIGVGQVIKGWDEGVMSMRVGGNRTLTIPAELAYGNQAVGGVIPANATLVFDVDLLSID